MGAWARRRDHVEDIGQQRVGAEAFGQHGEPVAPDARAIAAGEADDHERVVVEAKLTSHKNRMGTLAQTSRGLQPGVWSLKVGQTRQYRWADQVP